MTVEYNANGGVGSHVDTDIAEGSQYTIKSTGATGISRSGYTFIIWNTQPDGSGVSYEPGTRITITGDVTLYAQWQSDDPTMHTVTYNANGGIGSYVDTDIPEGSQYTIKSTGATGISRPGYTFTGWNTQPDGSGTSYEPGTRITITGDVTLYAQWTQDASYSVTYNANGGTGSRVDTDIPGGSQYTIKSTGATGISRPGYTFTGWNTQPDGSGTSYEPGTRITITGDVTLYAQWTQDASYSVTYNANGGTGSRVDTNIPGGSQYTIKSTGATGISRPGYTFTGWNTLPDGSGTSYEPGTRITITGDVTLYAQWAIDDPMYTVTYNANGGTGSYIDTNIPSGSQYTIKSLTATGISRPGYTFTGWNTQPDGSGVSYEPGTRITVTGNVTLYAQWKSDNTPCCRPCCTVCCNPCCNSCCRPRCCLCYNPCCKPFVK